MRNKKFTNRLLKDKHIAIIGGGPGGLSFASILNNRGIKTTVYEREVSPTERIQGGSLDLHKNSGLAAIKAAGLSDEFKQVSRPEGQHHVILDKKGVIHLDIPAIKLSSSKPEIDRGVLRDLLLSTLDPNRILWNQCFIELKKMQDTRYELLFSDGCKVLADLVIGCDGIHSRIRRYITDIKPIYSGVTLIEAEVENPKAKCPEIMKWIDKGNMIVLADCKGLMFQEKGDGNLIFWLTSRQPENWVNNFNVDFTSVDSIRTFMKNFLADWNPIFHQLINAARDDFRVRPMYGTPIKQTWQTKHNITLLGDAAHVMPPFDGQGANMAMRDALDLADCLTSSEHPDLYSALVSYETMMLHRSSKAQFDTKKSEDLFHEPNALNKLMKAILGPFTPLRRFVPSTIHALNRITKWI